MDPRVFGDLGEWLFIFRELGSTENYFQGSGEQAHKFSGLRRACPPTPSTGVNLHHYRVPTHLVCNFISSYLDDFY